MHCATSPTRSTRCARWRSRRTRSSRQWTPHARPRPGPAALRAGIGSYLDVLTAQSTLLQSQQQLAGLQSQVQTSVRLSKALGGGFQPADTDRAPIASHSDSSHS